MSITKPKTFHDAIKPLVYFNYFVGLRTFQLPNQRGSTYKFMELYAVIITLISWTLACIVLSLITLVTDDKNTAILAITMRRVVICANSGFAVFAPFLAWFQRKVLRDCLRHITILDHTSQVVPGTPNKYRRQYILTTRRVIVILLVPIGVGIFDTIQMLETVIRLELKWAVLSWTTMVAVHYPILLMLLLDLNFCTFVGYLGQKFRDLNDNLLGSMDELSTSHRGKRLSVISRDVMRSTSRNTVKDARTDDLLHDKHYLLRETRKAHLELCKLASKINCAFGIQNLLSMGISFVMVTGALYTIYSAFLWKNLTSSKLMEVATTVIWTATYVSKIWLVNHFCWSTSSEAERTGEVIYELLDSRIDRQVENEIQHFGVQMLQNPVRFNARGFFTLDYTFVQGVIGSITTYLVILIQMTPRSGGFSVDTTHAGNGTEVSENQ